MDPDRWAEEKRRGLTIDLGYAWCTLPSGREIGFVDVPGHERFIGNMLAGVGPVRLVLFVVAADEGWKPQSEEHLQILDVLGVSGGVIALTKRDLVDDETLEIAADEVRERVAGTGLSGAPIVPVSSETGEGVDALASALDVMLDLAGPSEDARTRLHHRSGVHHQGGGHRGDGNAFRRMHRCRRRRRGLPDRPPCAHPLAADPQASGGTRLPRLARRGEPGRRRARPARAWRRARDAGDMAAHAHLRRATATRTGTEPRRSRRAARSSSTSAPRRSTRVCACTGPPSSRRARKRSLGSRRRRRSCSTSATGSSFARADEGKPSREESCSTSALRLGRESTPSRARRPARRRRETSCPPGWWTERGAIRAADVYGLTGSRAVGGTAVGEWLVTDALRASVEASVVEVLAAFHVEHPLDAGADLSVARRAVIAVAADRARPDRRGARRRAPQRPERARRHGARGGRRSAWRPTGWRSRIARPTSTGCSPRSPARPRRRRPPSRS